MDTVFRVDEPDARLRRPTLDPANHSQFHEIAISIDHFAAVAGPCIASNSGSGIWPFAQDDMIFQRNGSRSVSKEARLCAEPDGAK